MEDGHSLGLKKHCTILDRVPVFCGDRERVRCGLRPITLTTSHCSKSQGASRGPSAVRCGTCNTLFLVHPIFR